MPVEIGRILNLKNALAVSIPAKVAREIAWNGGDRIAIRVAGDKLILERVRLEGLAVLRTGEVRV